MKQFKITAVLAVLIGFYFFTRDPEIDSETRQFTSQDIPIKLNENKDSTKSMIDLVKNPGFKDQLAELVNNKYPVALAVASINAMENGNFKEASNLALSNRAYSNKSMTYPHVLYGEALLADNMKIVAVSEFFVAGILGDPMANGRALNLSPDNAFTVSALSYAQNYLKNLYGLNIPKDPRPDYD